MNAPVVVFERHSALLRRTWIAILLLVAVDGVWMHISHITLSTRTPLLVGIATVLLMALSLIYRTLRRDDAIALAAQVISQMILGSCALAVFSYLGLLLQAPMMDAQFTNWDKALGFDWLAYIGWVEQHPFVARILSYSYVATGPEIIVMLLLLCFCRQFVAFHRFALGYLLGGWVTVLVAGFWPGLTLYIYRGIAAGSYPHLHIAEAIQYKEQFFAMRNHTLAVLPQDFQGLVAFPSFHSVLAVLAIYGALAIPSRILRWGIIIINLLMLLSTPVDGGHYLVDTLAGIALGVVAVFTAAYMLPLEKDNKDIGL